MIKVLYTRINGYLLVDIAAVLTLLPLDTMTIATLQANVNFAGGEWTYLTIDNGVYSEEVKITGISGSYAVAVRGASGSTPRAFAALGTQVKEVVGIAAIQDIVAAAAPPPSIVIGTAGLAYNAGTVGAPIITVDAPNIVGDGSAIDVIGNWPNLEIHFNKEASGCCGEGTAVGSGPTILSITSTILQGNITGDTLSLALASPTFTGAGGTAVTGVWPNFTITSAAGAGGSGTVTSVAVGGGLALTGNPSVNPSIAMSNTGVTAGIYGGVGINARGQIYQLPAGFSPISNIAIVDGASVSRTGGDITITFDSADVGVRGLVALADSTAPLNPADSLTAVSPALLAASLVTSTQSNVAGASTGEADASYTAPITSTNITLSLLAGEKAILIGDVQILSDATPLTAIAYGIGVFDTSNVRKFASKIATQSNQSLVGSISGPFSGIIHIVTTALPAGSTIQGAHLSVIKI